MADFVALVLYETCEINYVAELQNELAAEGIDLIAVPRGKLTSVDLPNKTFLFYSDPLIRISKTREVCEFAIRCGFKTVSSGCYTLVCRKEHLLEEFPYVWNDVSHFKASNIQVSTIIPKTAPLPILMVTHKRHEYLPLTMNSLVYSLGEDFVNVPLHILMSKPSKEIKNLCLTYAEKHKNIILYEAENNVAGAGFNILLQWLKPERFVIWEEDFILPQLTRELIPHWNRRFNNRLNFFDLIGFTTSKINAPRAFRSNVPEDLWCSHKQVTGNSLAISLKNYVTAPKSKPHFITADGVLVTTYTNSSFCMVQGYHIGFNQEMDGHKALFDDSRFAETNAISDQQSVICINTGETREFFLSQIAQG